MECAKQYWQRCKYLCVCLYTCVCACVCVCVCTLCSRREGCLCSNYYLCLVYIMYHLRSVHRGPSTLCGTITIIYSSSRFRGSHGDKYEDCYFMKDDSVYCDIHLLTFQTKVPHPSSGWDSWIWRQ